MFAQHRQEARALLIDMMMPIMDGPLTIRALLRLNPDVPIVAMSGLTAKGQAPELAGLGVQAFLHKPYTAHKLLTTLAEALRPETESQGRTGEEVTKRGEKSRVAAAVKASLHDAPVSAFER